MNTIERIEARSFGWDNYTDLLGTGAKMITADELAAIEAVIAAGIKYKHAYMHGTSPEEERLCRADLFTALSKLEN
jgi:hypothetical protein